jgi:phenol/toluene 2-monooxygenase (NADH) P5/A5
MAVVALEPGYEGTVLDARENFGPNQLVYLHWEKHLMFCAALAFPLPPEMPFAALVGELIPQFYGPHPDFDPSTGRRCAGRSTARSSCPTWRRRSATRASATSRCCASGHPASTASASRAPDRLDTMTYQLTIEPIEELVDVADGQTLLDACLRAGVWLPHACGHGLCGTCKVQVLEGDVEHGDASPFALMDLERDDGYTLACSATATSDVTIEADVDEEPDAVSRPVRDFAGTVARLEHLTADILGVWIGLDEPIEFQAGQYVNLHVPGVERPRAFSIASSPSSEKEIELHVRLVPGGEATPRLHTELAVGDPLRFSGPYGRFFVRRSAAKPMLFLAGGSGLSSPKSMVLDLLETGCEQPITLVHGVRTGERRVLRRGVHGARSRP